MNVLSLFDGMSCGRIALERIGMKVDKYFASEIEKNAIEVTQHNYPDTIQLGDVSKVKAKDLPKIDLLLGGSPCQGFSLAGKQLNFNDSRSKLFFEYVRLLKETKPKYFLLENVMMKKEHEDIITEFLGVKPIKINSKLVSAQLRQRIYWTNIPGLQQPNDKKIMLKDIIQGGITDKNKAYCLTLHRGNLRDYFKKSQTTVVYIPNPEGRYEVKENKISMTFKKGKNPDEIFRFKTKVPDGRYDFRPLNADECELCQTVPLGYTSVVAESQRCNMLGNGWTVDVIAHIFKGLKEAKNEERKN